VCKLQNLFRLIRGTTSIATITSSQQGASGMPPDRSTRQQSQLSMHLKIKQQTWCLFGDSCSGVMHMWNSRPLGDRVICAPGPARTGHGCMLAWRMWALVSASNTGARRAAL